MSSFTELPNKISIKKHGLTVKELTSSSEGIDAAKGKPSTTRPIIVNNSAILVSGK